MIELDKRFLSGNASATLQMTENGVISVYGRFSDGLRRHDGPEISGITTMPAYLMEEATSLKTYSSLKSAELYSFIQKVWKLAEETNGWFKR